MTLKLTATQTTVIKSAAARPDGNIEPLPANLRGGARIAVIDGLLARDLITKFQCQDRVGYYLTDAAYATVGRKRKVPAPVMPDPEIEAAVIAILNRPDGTTVQQVMEANGWLAHTVRGTFTGALKKKVGLNIVSEKSSGGERTYRIA